MAPPNKQKIKKPAKDPRNKSDFGDGFIPKKKDKSDFSGPNKGPRNKSDFANKNKSKDKIAQRNDKSDFSGGNKFTPKAGGSKTKPKVVTPAMIKAKGFTTLRDYLNNEKGLTRKDKKPVVKTTKTTKTTKTSDDKKTKTSKVVQPPIRAPRGANKIVSSMKSSNTGIDGGSSEVNKVKAKKKSSFFDSIGSGIKKAVKETKRNFSGDFKKKTGRYKPINKGTSNIIGSKNFVSDKKKKKK